MLDTEKRDISGRTKYELTCTRVFVSIFEVCARHHALNPYAVYCYICTFILARAMKYTPLTKVAYRDW